ncbi:MAG: hypothetical protein ACI3Y5_03520 [Prevotella sp.]
MKKTILSVIVAVMALSSCTTVTKTATSLDVENSMKTATTADLVVSQKKISYTHRTTKKERKAGNKNILNTAVQAALEANGGGDVLVAPQFTSVRKTGLFGSKIKTVIVTGYPASYKNFKSE